MDSLTHLTHLEKEYDALRASIAPGGSLQGINSLSKVNPAVWRFEVTPEAFDAQLPLLGRLREELCIIEDFNNHPKAIIMEARFPADYPTSPIFLRIVSPKFKCTNGPITAGGAIFIEALTLSGSPGSWKPSFTIESVLPSVLHHMATAKAGSVSPLALNLSKGERFAAEPYLLEEAQAGYKEALMNLKRGGNAVFRQPQQHLAPQAPPAAPPPTPPAPAVQPHPPRRPRRGGYALTQTKRTRPEVQPDSGVIDLSVSDDEEEARPARPAAAAAGPAYPTVKELLLDVNMHFSTPPVYWKISKARDGKNPTFVLMPTSAPAGHPGASFAHSAALNPANYDSDDLQLLKKNGVSELEAMVALDAAGRDFDGACDYIRSKFEQEDEIITISEHPQKKQRVKEEVAALDALQGGFNVVDAIIRAFGTAAESPIVLYNVASPAECAALIGDIEDTLSSVWAMFPAANTGSAVINNLHPSTSHIFYFDEPEVANVLKQRISAALGIPTAFFETLHAVRYRPGGAIVDHRDAEDRTERTYTLIIYLNDDFEGGETMFPQCGTNVAPRQGMAAVWRNLGHSGRALPSSIHAGCAVKAGTKYVCTITIRSSPLPDSERRSAAKSCEFIYKNLLNQDM